MFADKESLTTPKTAEELAEMFGINADDLKKVFVLYYSKHGGADFGTMTMPVFADFVVNEVAKIVKNISKSKKDLVVHHIINFQTILKFFKRTQNIFCMVKKRNMFRGNMVSDT